MSGTVLVVDDSLTVRMDLAEAFEAAGFRSIPCATLAEARSVLAARSIHAVILDVILPDGDGIELLRLIRAAPGGSSIAVLLLSSEAEVRDRIRGLQTGADEYVGKPYDSGYVVSRAAALMRSRGRASEGTMAVLVIDDSMTYRNALAGGLEGAGYAVITASSGEEGLRIAADRRPTAIVVDGILPGIDGATVIRRIRLDAALRRTPCLLLTSSDAEGAELRALDAGADAFVRKEEDIEVVLARLAAALRQAGTDPGVRTTSMLGPKRILAVDDSATYLHALADTLRGEGYDVVLARSGAEALELIAVQSVDCILLDLLMPGLSGVETCGRIKSAPVVRDIPLIMLTSLEDRSAMIEGLSAGADDYIPKSGDFEVLKARVRAQLRRKQFEDENRHMREQLLRKEMEAGEARAARQLADTRASLVEELERKNRQLEQMHGELRLAVEGALDETKRAESANNAKSKFLASMSHELRTPLNSIIGFCELLTQGFAGELAPRQAEFLDNVLLSGRHLLSLINDVLDLSKVEAGRMKLARERTALPMIVAQVHEQLRPLMEHQQLAFSADIAPDFPEIVVDPTRLLQILYNLLSNAIKFTPRGGHVSVRGRRSGGDAVEISVEDDGIGIRPEDVPRLFQEFEQLETSRRKPVANLPQAAHGTGLGLSLTKGLVELHGGTIEVQSVDGSGSTFIVRLPLQPGDRRRGSHPGTLAAVVNEPARAHDEHAVAVECLRIVLVEDDPGSRLLVRAVLERHGHEVFEAGTVDEARALLDTTAPQLVVTDIQIPGGGGEGLLDEIRARPSLRRIPVIATTAQAMQGDRERLLLRGFDAYVSKPIDTRALPGLVASLLAGVADDDDRPT